MTIAIQKLNALDKKIQEENKEKKTFDKIYTDLRWNKPYYRTLKPVWKVTSGIPQDKVDINNRSIESVYPEDYNESANFKARIFGGDVRFFTDSDYWKTLNAKVSEFSALDSPKFYGKTTIPVLPTGTYIDILETTSHKRQHPKEKNKSYWYIMCKIRISANQYDNVIPESLYITPGETTGFVWHTFMGEINPNPNANIGYALIPGSPAEDPIQRAIMDYNNYSIPYPDKAQPDIKINFVSNRVGNCKANGLNKVLKTTPILFETLHYAAIQPGVNVSEINIGFLDYTDGETNSHSDGRACDIGSIKADGNEHTYTVKYDEESGVRLQPVRHESIGRFEEAFMGHGNSDVIWGPWFFHKRTGETETDFTTNPNLIETYPEMLEKWPDETTVSGTNTKSKKQVFIEQYVIPFILYEVARNGYKAWKIGNDEYELVEYDTTKNKTKWNDIFYYHFQHRHHGHYAVKYL